ncbi:hypothetical protein PIB30_108434, partial [Stylosanthes scabra]|nr:hypothetical protein [Stylosanthes scabra]
MTEHISIDWILKLDAISGEVIPFQFPFSFTYEGWFDIIGIENGVFCIRYSEDGSPNRLAIWNPLTNRGHSFHDPLQQHCNDCAYLYAFAYFPNTLQYAVLHISNADEDADNLTLSMYTSFTRDWIFQLPCPGFATLLEPCCVSIKGIMERHMGVFGVEHINLTHFDIARYEVATADRKTLQWIEYDENVT